LTFLANGQFVRPDDTAPTPIRYKYACTSLVPQQILVTSAVKTLEAAGALAKEFMNYMLYGNLGL